MNNNTNTEFETKRTEICAWLDAVIAHHEALCSLGDGETNGTGITVCGLTFKEIHLYNKLEEIAFYLGATIIYDPTWDTDRERGCMTMYYNGIRLFQLWELKGGKNND